MGKLITAVLAIAVIAGAAWYALRASAPAPQPMGATSGATGPSAPKRQLDNVRQSARNIESDADQRARDLDAKTAP